MRLCDDTQVPVAELGAMLSAYEGETVLFTGDAYDAVRKELGNEYGAQTPPRLRWQSAYGVARAAYEKWNKTSDRSVFTDVSLNPVYLKKSQAEREREERLNSEK